MDVSTGMSEEPNWIEDAAERLWCHPALILAVWVKLGSNSIRAANGCNVWLKGRTAAGYGQIWALGKVHYTHRLAYELLIGPIPDGLELDHGCRNVACWNPYHLEPVTHEVNILRGESPYARKPGKPIVNTDTRSKAIICTSTKTERETVAHA